MSLNNLTFSHLPSRWPTCWSSFIVREITLVFFHLVRERIVPHVEGNRRDSRRTVLEYFKVLLKPAFIWKWLGVSKQWDNSQLTHGHWEQHRPEVAPYDTFPQDAAGLNPSHSRVPVANWTHTEFCQRHLSLKISSTPRNNKAFRIRHRRPE